jgi:hypothetical protein
MNRIEKRPEMVMAGFCNTPLKIKAFRHIYEGGIAGRYLVGRIEKKCTAPRVKIDGSGLDSQFLDKTGSFIERYPTGKI